MKEQRTNSCHVEATYLMEPTKSLASDHMFLLLLLQPLSCLPFCITAVVLYVVIAFSVIAFCFAVDFLLMLLFLLVFEVIVVVLVAACFAFNDVVDLSRFPSEFFGDHSTTV